MRSCLCCVTCVDAAVLFPRESAVQYRGCPDHFRGQLLEADTDFTMDVTEGHLIYKGKYRATPTLQETLQRDTDFTSDVTEGHPLYKGPYRGNRLYKGRYSGTPTLQGTLQRDI